jgi:hypothetical protein
LVSVLLAAVALISCLSADNKRAIRRLPRAVWVALILLVPVVGATAWFLFGRPLSLRVAGTGSWLPVPGSVGRSTGSAPDDDAEFLRSLDRPPDRTGEDDEQGR